MNFFVRWWKRLCHPGDPQPEYVFGDAIFPDSDRGVFGGCNVSEVTWYTVRDGRVYPIYDTDGKRLCQHIAPGHLHCIPAALHSFCMVVPIAQVLNESLEADVWCM